MIEAYTALLADWRAGLSGDKSDLTKHLLTECIKIQRRANPGTTAANTIKRVRNGYLTDEFMATEPSLARGNTPADLIRWRLFIERIRFKGEGKENDEPEPITKLLQQLKEAKDRVDPEEHPQELVMIETEMKRVRKVLGKVMGVADRLKVEADRMTAAFNMRIEYFRQLQIINDDVQDPDLRVSKWKGMANEIEAREDIIAAVEKGLEKKRDHSRYVTSIATNELEGSGSKEASTCPVCLDADYSKGVLTDCGKS